MDTVQVSFQMTAPVSELSRLTDSDSSERLNDALNHHLSPRQTQVLLLMLQGHSRSEIAKHLNVSARTVDTTRARMMVKLKAKSNTELAIKAFALCNSVTA